MITHFFHVTIWSVKALLRCFRLLPPQLSFHEQGYIPEISWSQQPCRRARVLIPPTCDLLRRMKRLEATCSIWWGCHYPYKMRIVGCWRIWDAGQLLKQESCVLASDWPVSIRDSRRRGGWVRLKTFTDASRAKSAFTMTHSSNRSGRFLEANLACTPELLSRGHAQVNRTHWSTYSCTISQFSPEIYE